MKKIKSRTSSDKEKNQSKSPSSPNKTTNSSSPSTPTKVSPSVHSQSPRHTNPNTPVKSSNTHTGTAPLASSSSSSSSPPSSSTKHHHSHIPNVLKHSSSILRLKSIKSNQSLNSSSDHSHDDSSKAQNTTSTRRTSTSSVASIHSAQISNGLNKPNLNSSPTHQTKANVINQSKTKTPVNQNAQQEAVHQKHNSLDPKTSLKPSSKAEVQPLQPTQPIQQLASSSSNKTTHVLASHPSHHYPAVAPHSNEKHSSEQKIASNLNKTLQTSPSHTKSSNSTNGKLPPKKAPISPVTQTVHSVSKPKAENSAIKESKPTRAPVPAPAQPESQIAPAPIVAVAAAVAANGTSAIDGKAENISSPSVNIPGNRDGVLLNPEFQVPHLVTDSAKSISETAFVDSSNTATNSITKIKTAPDGSTKTAPAVLKNSSRPLSAVSASSSVSSNSSNKGFSSFSKMKNVMKSIKIGSRNSSPALETPSKEALNTPENKSTVTKLETDVEKLVEKVTETIVNIETSIVDGVNQTISPRVVPAGQDGQILDDADSLIVQHQPIKTVIKSTDGKFKELDEDEQNENTYQALISSIMANFLKLQKEIGSRIDSAASSVSSSISSNADSLKKTIGDTSVTISSISKNTYSKAVSRSSDFFAAASTGARNNALLTSDVTVAICTGGLLAALLPRSKQNLALGTAITTGLVLVSDLIFRFGYLHTNKV